jgi:hypothetical protein
MSTNLYWKKVAPTRDKSLGDGLKWAIEKKYGRGPTTLTETDIPFLEGVQAAQFRANDETANDCQTLIDAIHDSECGVEVWIAE